MVWWWDFIYTTNQTFIDVWESLAISVRAFLDTLKHSLWHFLWLCRECLIQTGCVWVIFCLGTEEVVMFSRWLCDYFDEEIKLPPYSKPTSSNEMLLEEESSRQKLFLCCVNSQNNAAPLSLSCPSSLGSAYWLIFSPDASTVPGKA